MPRRGFLVLWFLLLTSPAWAGEGEGYTYKIDTTATFEKFAYPERFLPAVDRTTKFLVPSKDDPKLLKTVFQNANTYPFHQEFMVTEFPDRFAGMDGREYLALVEIRATRSYFAGVLLRFPGEPDATYGFDVFTPAGNRSELPKLEEMQRVHRLLSASFTLGLLSYAPRSQDAINNAKAWIDPGFPINFSFGSGLPEYIAYTLAENYGRVRIMTSEEFHEANETGGFGAQDIVVVEEAPTDIEGVIAGVFTGSIQGELGHLAIRTARRGTPNAYLKNCTEVLKSYDDKLVRVKIELTRYEIREAQLPEAEAWWAEHRPKIGAIQEADLTYKGFDAVWEVPVDGSVNLLSRFGGKGSNFARLYSLLKPENRVPAFLLPFFYYQKFMESNRTKAPFDPAREVNYMQYIEELTAHTDFRGDSKRRFAELAKLREIIRGDDSKVDPALVQALALRVVTVFGSGNLRVRFRSSSNSEDLLEFNGAGLYNSTGVCAADDLDAGTAGPSRCDATEPEERGIARAMKLVYSSLWNYRAFEERDYYGISHSRVRMAIVVSEAFPDELANGVAFTGNPTLIGDRRFLINVQVGDNEVVFPDPGVVAEKDILEVQEGQVTGIIRARSSTLVKPGELVLEDDHLKTLGAAMARVEKGYAERKYIDFGTHNPEAVVLDFEFKLDKNKQIRLKQVRPFLIPSTGPTVIPEFKLKVPEGYVMCSSFFEGRPVRETLKLKMRLGLKAGEHVVRADSTSSGDFFEWLQLSPDGPLLTPLGKGIWNSEVALPPDPGIRLNMSQDFKSGNEVLHLSVKNFLAREGGEPDIEIDGAALTWAINQYTTRIELTFPNDPEDTNRTTWFLPCDLSHLPIINIDVEFAGGDRVHFTERFQDVLDGTGPAELIGAKVTLGGTVQEVTDYWRLGYAAGHHNDTPYPDHWVILDRAVDVPGAGPVKAISVFQGFRELGGTKPVATFMDENLSVLSHPEIVLFRRQREGDQEIPQFRRGDANSSGRVNITDAIAVLLYEFAGGEVACLDAADVDDIGTVDISDAILLLQYLFFNLDPPTAPGPLLCGQDLEDSPDDLAPCEGSGCR